MKKKIICDQMLGRLGRWLRAAGYDTIIIEKSQDDVEIFKLACEENRLLLTRDKGIKELDLTGDQVLWLQTNSTQDCAKELSTHLKINWLLNPFSRCLQCNHLLIETDKPDFSQIPEDIQRQCHHFWYCSQCDKVYWEGSHTKRMRSQLEQWQAL